MSARYLSLAVILSMAAPCLAETDEGSRSAGARHHSRSVSSDESRQGPPTAVRRGSSDGASTGAQGRHPRAGSGHGPRRGYYGYYGRRYHPYAYWGYGGYPYFDFYGPGAYGYYGPRYYGGYYGGHYRRDYGSVRVLVDPSETRVFVDGHYAGTADEFDGLFQRLHVPPGRHEITLKLDGYRTHRLRVYVPYDGTLKLHHDMAQGSGEDAVEDLAGEGYADGERFERARDEERRDTAWADEPERVSESGERAWLRLEVRPEGASVYVDGQFRGTGRSVRRLELPAGTHRVEILHPGLRSFERDVDLEEGESEELEVELTR